MSATATIATPADDNSYALGRVRVWIMAPIPYVDPATNLVSGYTFPWAWSSWKEEKRLIPTAANKGPGSMGSASFTMLRRIRTEPRQNFPVETPNNVIEGAYICITIGTATAADDTDTSANPTATIDPASIQWVGYITAVNGEIVRGTTEHRGTVQARELGGMLDMQQIVGWRRAVTDGGYPETITTPPTANMGTGTTTIVGNAKSVAAMFNGGPAGYVFARLPADCGTSTSNIWTRDRLLKHLIYACKANALPSLSLVYVQAAIQAYLDDFSIPEVFELRNLTFKGALDLLVPQARGLGWYITASQTAWTVNLFSYADSNAYGMPLNAPIDVPLNAADPTGTNQPVDSVSFSYNYDVPDEVVIEGNPIVFCGTVSFTDDNFVNGWTQSQEAAYLAGASLNLNGSSNAAYYDPLDTAHKRTLNAAIRESSSLRDVFTRFLLQASTRGNSGDLHVSDPPGAPGARGDRPFCPQVYWNGSTLRFYRTISHSPYLPAARVLRTNPWPEGVKSDGTDARSAAAKAAPQFLPIRVFRHDATLDPQWRDQNAENGRPALPSLSVEPDDHGLGVRIRFHPAEVLAHGHWTGGEPADIDPDTDGVPFDWQQLYVTLALEGDERVRVAKRRQVVKANGNLRDLEDGEVRNRVVIPAPDLNCWLVHSNTALGLSSKGKPDFMTGTNCIDGSDGQTIGYLTRNDFPVAEKRANQAAAFLLRSRAACTITRARFDALPNWARIGYMIGSVIEASDNGIATVSNLANTVVTSVAFTFGNTPRVSIATDFPTMPTFTPLAGASLGGSGSSPTSGGSVSASLSGTPAQALSRLAGAGALAMDRDTQRILSVVPRASPVSDGSFSEVVITGGNTLADSSAGIKYVAAGVASVPSLYNPNITTTFIDGIGRGQLFVDGSVQSGYVLVVLDNRSPVVYALKAGEYVATPTTVQIPVTGSSPVQYVTCYVPVWV